MKNIEACKNLAQITRTSLGPNGMNKLVVNHLEKLFITSDAATIVEELEVVHPAAKMLARAAHEQVKEVGDGSNLVISLAGELLNQAEALLRIGVHPSEIVAGYKSAADKCAVELETMAAVTLDNMRDKASLVVRRAPRAGPAARRARADAPPPPPPPSPQRALTPVIASKQMGYEELLADLVADAVLTTMPAAGKKAAVSVDNVRVAKLIGGSVSDSQVVRGVVINRDADSSVKHVAKAKIAVFGCSIEASAPETKGVVVIKTADELKAYNKGEERMVEETIKGIADRCVVGSGGGRARQARADADSTPPPTPPPSGAKVVVAGGSISEIALHFIQKYGMLAVRIPSKFELRRLCKAVNASALVRVGPPLPAELGYCDSVSVQELSSRLVTVFRQDAGEDSGIATIVLRGATMNLLDDMERAIDDAAHVARMACKDGRFVAGGGAAEMELAHRLHAAADKVAGLEAYAFHKFAEALECVPRTLAENSGQNATAIVAALYAAHAAGKASVGVDVDGGETKDTAAAGILDCLAVKASAIKLAAETAITILRVDQIIMSKQAGGPKPKAPGPNGDDD